MQLKMSSGKWRPSCLGLNVLRVNLPILDENQTWAANVCSILHQSPSANAPWLSCVPSLVLSCQVHTVEINPLTLLPLDKMAAILPDNIFNCIFWNRNDWIPIQISLKYVPRSSIDNKPASVQVMAWRRTGDKPLTELMMTQFIDAYMRH